MQNKNPIIMTQLKTFIANIFYAFPVRLLIRQIHKHKILLLFWLVLLSIASGWIGRDMGGAYLFLEPEYLGKESFWSLFIVGSTLGGFLFAYMITLFINESYRFHFVALTKSPFYTLSFNNLLVPGSFLIFYFYTFLQYHIGVSGGFTWLVAEKLAGLVTGISVVFLISASYFFANRTFFHWFGQKLEKKLDQGKKSSRRNRWIILGKARASMRIPQRTDSYIAFPFRVVKIDPQQAPPLGDMVRQLNQNHGKLLITQVLIFVLIAVLGLMEENPYFQIPAGASLLLVCSLAMMTFGAVTFWFRKSGMLTMIGAIVILYLCNNGTFFKDRNPAFGMDYATTPAAYDADALKEIISDEIYEQDRAYTLQLLENWKNDYQKKYGTSQKPRAIFASASGGGLRSAFWTFRVMQRLDSLTQGEIGRELRVMSGASGGMFGLSYYRELYWRKLKGEIPDLTRSVYSERISKDLLNRIFFQKFAGIILPTIDIEVDGISYPKETGYSFDHQLGINIPEFSGRKLGDYTQPEVEGKLPVVIMEPSIINQGRKLYISSSPVSFLSRANRVTEHFFSRSSGVEFRRMFKEQQADSLYLSSALRMNSTFPFILPVVELPSHPQMQVMDAGAIDNYGTQTAVRYLFEFKDWFEKNTSGVVFLQIRDHTREDPIGTPAKEGIFSKIITPLGGGYANMIEAKDMSNEYLLEYVKAWYKGYVEVVPIAYNTPKSKDRASLSWHLTRREKQNIESSLLAPENQQAFEMIHSLYGPRLLANSRTQGRSN